MIERLNPRERRLALAALVILGPLLLLRLVVFPLVDLKSGYQSDAKRLAHEVERIHRLGQEFRLLGSNAPRQVQGLGPRISGVLRSQGVLERASLNSQNAQGRSQSLLVQIDQLTLTEAMKVIYQTEHLRPAVAVETLDLQRSFQNAERLKLSLVVSAP